MAIVISGLSVWTCFGRGPASLLSAMQDAVRYFEPVEVPWIEDPWFKTKRGMQIPIPADIESRWTGATRSVTEFEWPAAFAIETALDAIRDAGPITDRYAPDRIAVCNGTSHGSNHGLLEYLRQDHAGLEPNAALLADLPSIVSARIAEVIGATGVALTFNTACSAGINAIGQGMRLIESGRVDCVIAGAHDTFSLLSFAGFTSLKALDPAGARPFDVARQGLSLGDGAAYVVLERAVDVLERGGKVRATLGGYGYVGEAYHPTAPDPEGSGVEVAMRAALVGVPRPERLAFVSAHGTGTPANDEAELRAIARVATSIGVGQPVDVVSLKSQTGHSLGAAGAVQAVAAILAMEHDLIPANVTLSDALSGHADVRLPKVPHTRSIPIAMCNALGFGGSVAALTLLHPDLHPDLNP